MTTRNTTREDTINNLKRLFTDQKLAVLSTQKAGQPYANLVAFSFSEDLRYLYFLTPEDTRKYENLAACDRVALLIHSAANREEDFSDAMAVTALGKAETVKDKSAHLKNFLARHPRLAEFSEKLTTVMIRIEIESFVTVNRFQNVVELRMDR
ncbi:MAG: pyridoxamine 5'-phosphate oxidase family protein [Desulfobacterales bacterium]|nr:pyridoxamine 5'-phosphate oxidase family protein [Desulfobacterales bacterium]